MLRVITLTVFDTAENPRRMAHVVHGKPEVERVPPVLEREMPLAEVDIAHGRQRFRRRVSLDREKIEVIIRSRENDDALVFVPAGLHRLVERLLGVRRRHFVGLD